MSRPIPVEVVPSHLHLSEDDHRILFGDHHSGTVQEPLSQTGQFVYEDVVEVVGPNGKSLALRVLGPSRKSTQVELTQTEADLLGLRAPQAVSGALEHAGECVLRTSFATLEQSISVIIPQAHLHLSDGDARALRLEQGSVVRVDLVGTTGRAIDDIAVRVHPTYRTRLHINADQAREWWLQTGVHVRVRDIQNSL